MVKRTCRILCRYEHIIRLPFYGHKAEAVGMALEHTCYLRRVRLHVLALLRDCQLSLRNKTVKHALKLMPVLLRNI